VDKATTACIAAIRDGSIPAREFLECYAKLEWFGRTDAARSFGAVIEDFLERDRLPANAFTDSVVEKLLQHPEVAEILLSHKVSGKEGRNICLRFLAGLESTGHGARLEWVGRMCYRQLGTELANETSQKVRRPSLHWFERKSKSTAQIIHAVLYGVLSLDDHTELETYLSSNREVFLNADLNSISEVSCPA